MSYYWFNRQEILQKAAQNKEAIKEKSREHYKRLSQEEKDKITKERVPKKKISRIGSV